MTKQRLLTGIFAFGCLLGTIQPALAQSGDISQLNGRISQMENQIQTLSRAVFRGDTSAAAEMAGSLGSNDTSGAAIAQVDIRLGQLESQIQQLTGQIEEQQYRIDQLTRRMEAETIPPAGAAAQPARPMGTNTNVAYTTDPVMIGEDTGAMRPPAGMSPDELYEKSFVDIRDGNYDAAESGFKSFLASYPDHALSSNAQYWLAETFYVRANYTESAKLFAKGYQDYPDSPKAADNLLKLGLSLAKLGKTEDACLSFEQLKSQFPNESGPVMRRAEQEMKNLNCG